MPHHLGILHGTLKTSIASASAVERKALQLEENKGILVLAAGRWEIHPR